MPSAATSTEAVNACSLRSFARSGVLLILMGLDQVSPPSSDCENAIESLAKPLKRASCQTA